MVLRQPLFIMSAICSENTLPGIRSGVCGRGGEERGGDKKEVGRGGGEGEGEKAEELWSKAMNVTW